MTGSQQEELRLKLESLRSETLAGREATKTQIRTIGSKRSVSWYKGDDSFLESAQAEQDIPLPLHLAKDQTDRLRQIDVALNNLKHGKYGKCNDCGDEIEHIRLMALPFAIRCKDCQSEHDPSWLRAKEDSF